MQNEQMSRFAPFQVGDIVLDWEGRRRVITSVRYIDQAAPHWRIMAIQHDDPLVISEAASLFFRRVSTKGMLNE